MRIDLKRYSSEFSAFARVAEGFLAKESISVFKAVQKDLDQAIDSRTASFKWKTSKPLWTKEASRYDGVGKEQERVRIAFGFYAEVSRHSKGKDVFWLIERMETHFEIYAVNGQHHDGISGEDMLLKLHVDKKNAQQLGPHIHLQVSEEYIKEAKGIKLAVPRIPFGFVLPTDCLDFILSEFFGDDWAIAQNDAHSINLIRESQKERAVRLASELQKLWTGSTKRTPVSLMQNCYFPNLLLS